MASLVCSNPWKVGGIPANQEAIGESIEPRFLPITRSIGLIPSSKATRGALLLLLEKGVMMSYACSNFYAATRSFLAFVQSDGCPYRLMHGDRLYLLDLKVADSITLWESEGVYGRASSLPTRCVSFACRYSVVYEASLSRVEL